MSKKKKAVKKSKFGIYYHLDPPFTSEITRSEDVPGTYASKASAQRALDEYLSKNNTNLVGRFVKIIAMFLLALSLWTLPARAQSTSNPNDPLAAPQTEAQPPVSFHLNFYPIADGDRVAFDLQTAMLQSIVANKAIKVLTGAATVDEDSIMEADVVTMQVSDSMTSVVVVFTYHIKGQTAPLYIGVLGGEVTSEKVSQAAAELLSSLTEGALNMEAEPPAKSVLSPNSNLPKA